MSRRTSLECPRWLGRGYKGWKSDVPLKALVLVRPSVSYHFRVMSASTELRKELEERLKSFPNLQVRWVNSSTSAHRRGAPAPSVHRPQQALANTPPDRLAGVIIITDGQVHDVPKSAPRSASTRPVHALLTGKPDEFDRRIEVLTAPRYGIVGSTRDIEVARGRRPAARAAPVERRDLEDPPRGRADETRAASAARSRSRCRSRMPGRTSSRSSSSRPRANSPPANNRAVLDGRGRAREPARAAGLGRAACRRAHLAQPAEVRRRRRPRAFHHSAAAGEAGRHADQSALADRLPDARAVLGEDQRVRPDHLRPLPAPRHAAAALSTRTSPATWSRAARCWSPPATIMPAPLSLYRTPLARSCPPRPQAA